MLDFLRENASTIIVASIIGAGLIAIVIKLICDSKNGKKACGCNCPGCPSGGACGPEDQKEPKE